ncbi:MAG: hypothetical protein L6R41_004270 [Letrouitia leprolyta]|nr:MAG: hypothetical protein L6R41_004270 [Letrouitia leprolyta]
MDDELVELLLPVFRDTSIEDEDRTERAWELLLESSSKKGQALEDQRSRVFLMCREIVEGEIVAAAEERRRQVQDSGSSSRGPAPDPRNVPGKSDRMATQPLATTHTDLEKTGPSTQPSSSAQWASSGFNPTVGDFVPGRPLPRTREEKRAAYEQRIEGLRRSMAEKDQQIKNLQTRISWHNQEIVKWESAQDAPVEQYLTMLQESAESPMNTEAGRRCLTEASAAGDVLKQFKDARTFLMEEKRKAQEELEELYEDMLPREGESGPDR